MLLTLLRLRRLLAFDTQVLAEVRRDGSATLPALGTAMGSMLLYALGGWLWWWRAGLGAPRTAFLQGVVFGTGAALMLWLLWLLIVYALYQQRARMHLRMEELLRTAGFATAPLALGVFAVVPGIGFAVLLIALAAWVLATQAAIEEASGSRGGMAVAATLVGFAAWTLTLTFLSTAHDPRGPGLFLADSLWDAVIAYAPRVAGGG